MSERTPEREPRAFFVTGTDTDAGKTLVSCALLHGFAQAGRRCVGMKPVAAGATLHDGVWNNDDVLALQAVSNVVLPQSLINPYLFRLAAAPHIAAKQENKTIELAPVLTAFEVLAGQAEVVVVEGAGGFRVPLNAQFDMADLAQQLNLPVVLVVGMRLGCISHALLTVESIASRGLSLAGWVANCIDDAMPYLDDNIAALRERISAPLLGCIPRLAQPVAAAAAAYLNLTPLLATRSALARESMINDETGLHNE